MQFSDEKDYIMRMIKEMVRVLFSLMFGKQYISVEWEKMNKYSVSGKGLRELLDMVDLGQIDEAENVLLEDLDYGNKEEVMGAALFYQYLSEKDDGFLREHDYSKEEVLFGMKQLMEQSGYNDLISLLEEKAYDI